MIKPTASKCATAMPVACLYSEIPPAEIFHHVIRDKIQNDVLEILHDLRSGMFKLTVWHAKLFLKKYRINFQCIRFQRTIEGQREYVRLAIIHSTIQISVQKSTHTSSHTFGWKGSPGTMPLRHTHESQHSNNDGNWFADMETRVYSRRYMKKKKGTRTTNRCHAPKRTFEVHINETRTPTISAVPPLRRLAAYLIH